MKSGVGQHDTASDMVRAFNASRAQRRTLFPLDERLKGRG
jgi:hypothetical protein